jgi:sigma-B regulation protein RsbU (phosphoserine phosphatase)
LCAPRLLRFGDFEIASEIFAVRHLPGDFFTVEQTHEGVVLALGDICGKGLAAGMWTTHMVGMLRANTSRSSLPERIVASLNREIGSMSTMKPLASLFLAKLDVVTGDLRYCSAGHPPAFLLRANGEFESLSDGGLLLGAQDAAGEEFGYDRLKAELAKANSTSADAVLFSVLGAVQDFATIRPLMDDMTVAVIRRDGSANC